MATAFLVVCTAAGFLIPGRRRERPAGLDPALGAERG
jgi:hypothetical protein